MAQAGIGWAQPDIEGQQIARQRMMAEALRKQGETPIQGQNVSGHYVAPNWAAQLSQALSSPLGDYVDRRTDEKQQAYAEQLKAQGMKDVQDFTGALQGTPARTIQPLTPNDDEGNAMPSVDVAAQGPDRQKALAVALGSRNPMIQQAGGSILSSMMPKGAKYSVVERFNDKTGAKEKVIIDENNPSAPAMPFGGTEAVKGISVNGQIVDPTKIGTTVAKQADAPKPDDMFSFGPNGERILNPLVFDTKKQLAKSGASNVNVKVDTKLGEGLAKEVGPMVQASYDSALGAQKQIGVADNLIKAVDSEKVMAGPGANLRLRGAQFADVLGIGGKDNAEKIANTRTAIQGLAQSTLAQRAALKGQGSVSDFEGKLIARAASGEIDDMTPSEIKQIAQVNKRLAQQQVQQHRQMTSKLRTHESAKPLVDLFEIPEDAPAGAPKAASVLDAADAILKGGSNGKR